MAGAFQLQIGPDICTQVTGFLPHEQIDISYLNLPGIPALPSPFDKGVFLTDNTGALVLPMSKFVDTSFDFGALQTCTQAEEFAKTTILVKGLTSGRTASDTVRNGFFCGSTPAGVADGITCP